MESRKVTKFLWWPLHIGEEKRWFEKATWLQIYKYVGGQWQWINKSWIDDKGESNG